MRHDPMLDYLPMRLSLVPRLFDTVRRPDAVLLHTSLPRDGKVSLGIEVNVLPAAIEQARARGGLVLAQVNPRMPYTFGAGEIPLESIDGFLEVDEPLTSPASRRVRGGGRGDRRARRRLRRRRHHAAARHRADPHRGGAHDVETAEPARVVGDDQRRRHGPRPRRRARPRRARVHLLPDRLPRALPLGGRERAAPDAADRDRQRPGAHRRAPVHALGQRRHAGRPVRPGQRQLRGRAGSTRDSAGSPTSSPAPCTRRAATPSWPCTPGTTRRTRRPWSPCSRQPGDVVPALGGHQRARLRRAVRAVAARAGPADHRPGGRPTGPRRARGGGERLGLCGEAD